VNYKITDDIFISSLFLGFSPSFRFFKEQYDWVRSTKPNDPPDLDFLFNRLHIEELKQNKFKKEKKSKDKPKKENGDKPIKKKEDKSNLHCDICNKPGHTKDKYWTEHPELMPRAIKNRLNAKTDTKPEISKKDDNKSKNAPKKISALSISNITNFRAALSKTEDSDPTLPSPPTDQADLETQTTDASYNDLESRRIGGVVVRNKLKNAFLSEGTKVFITGVFNSSDI